MIRSSACGTVVVAWLAAGCASEGRANDTMAVVAAGGLQFTHTNELQMVREDLYLSPWEIRVAYVFHNLTNHDVTSTVAFPLPDIDVSDAAPHENYYLSANDGDVFDFHAEVDGRPIVPIFDARAYHGHRDVTALLHKHHLALFDKWPRPSLGKDAITELTRAGVLLDDVGNSPNWIVKAAYHWEQIFPAARDIQITHYYRPVLGGAYMSNLISEVTAPIGQYCPDEAFAKALSKLSPVTDVPSGWQQYLEYRELEYILSTGANWAGPIGHLRLELDKSDADLVTLCPTPGLHLVRKGRSFVAEAEQYTPTTDIKVMFIYGGKRTIVPPNQDGVALHPFTKARPSQ